MTSIQKAGEFSNLINLLAVFTEAENRLAEMQTAADDALTEILDDKKADFAKYQAARDEAENAIKLLAELHPEWLDGRTIKTPYGSVRFTRATALEVPNPEATVSLIFRTYGEGADGFVRKIEEPNLEALALLPDEELARLGITRTTKDSLTVKKAKVDMGKAAKAKAAKVEAAR